MRGEAFVVYLRHDGAAVEVAPSSERAATATSPADVAQPFASKSRRTGRAAYSARRPPAHDSELDAFSIQWVDDGAEVAHVAAQHA